MVTSATLHTSFKIGVASILVNKGLVPVMILGNLSNRKPPLQQQGLQVTALGLVTVYLPEGKISVSKDC